MLLTVLSFTAVSLTVVLLPAVSAVDEVSGGRQEVKARVLANNDPENAPRCLRFIIAPT